MGRRLGRAGTAIVVAALVATGLPPAPPASAGHQFLYWNSECTTEVAKFGNASITVDWGAIEFACDTFYPTADVYVVPSGAASGTLSDVSGIPNVVFGASGGLIVGETIGYAAPGGNIPAGTYAVVYDECQNGKVDPVDFVLDPAFEVVIPVDVPVLSDAGITAAKAQAQQQSKSWADAAKAMAALFVVYDTWLVISDFLTGGSTAMLLVNFYMSYGSRAQGAAHRNGRRGRRRG